jgi:hypothetical protein
MKWIVTMSDDGMSRAREVCALSAVAQGIDRRAVWTWESFKRLKCYYENKVLFDKPRGFGYWAWKAELIGYTLQYAKSNDVVVYADAGIEFIAPVSHIINRMDQDIFLFGNNWKHAHWCKRDVIDAIWPWTNARDVDGNELSWERFGKQCQASVIFFRVSDYSRAFVKEWLKWCLFEGGRLIDDSPSRAPNHPEFREHRHDQAILTTMAYRNGLTLHYWPASYNNGAFVYEKLPEYASDSYPILFSHHRRRNHEWKEIA